MNAQSHLYCYDCLQTTPQGHELACSSCGSQFVEITGPASPATIVSTDGNRIDFPLGIPLGHVHALLRHTAAGPPQGPGRTILDAFNPPTGYQPMPDYMPGFARPRWDPVPHPLPTQPSRATWTYQFGEAPGQSTQATPNGSGSIRVTTADDLFR
jgi:hypothetical protein